VIYKYNTQLNVEFLLQVEKVASQLIPT
jgi:hypothetical protein